MAGPLLLTRNNTILQIILAAPGLHETKMHVWYMIYGLYTTIPINATPFGCDHVGAYDQVVVR